MAYGSVGEDTPTNVYFAQLCLNGQTIVSSSGVSLQLEKLGVVEVTEGTF